MYRFILHKRNSDHHPKYNIFLTHGQQRIPISCININILFTVENGCYCQRMVVYPKLWTREFIYIYIYIYCEQSLKQSKLNIVHTSNPRPLNYMPVLYPLSYRNTALSSSSNIWPLYLTWLNIWPESVGWGSIHHFSPAWSPDEPPILQSQFYSQSLPPSVRCLI